MNRRITIVAATEKEIGPFLDYLRSHAEEHSFQTFQLHGLLIDILYSGIGIMQSTYSLMEYISHRHPNGWIQVGIGGAFEPSLNIGETYLIESEMLAGFGAEDNDGSILDPFTLGWSDPDAFPLTNGLMICPYQTIQPFPLASGMTTLHAHGYGESIAKLRAQPNGQIENMEGAPFFFISLTKRIPFLSFRAISNLVESRDRSKWKIDEAIQKLNESLLQILKESKLNPDKLFRLNK